MLRVINKVYIKQMPSDKYPTRNGVFKIEIMDKGMVNRSVSEMTATATLTFPKKVYIDQTIELTTEISDYSKQSLDLQDLMINNTNPFFLRGDKIKIVVGYQDDRSNYETHNIFSGFITKVDIKSPLTIECQDYMYILKQVTVKSQTYDTGLKGNSLELLIKSLLDTTWNGINLKDIFNIKVDNFQTNIGKFTIFDNATLATFFDELKTKFKFSIFLTDDSENDSPQIKTLHVGLIKYYPSANLPKNHIFHFQKNIISDSMTYNRLDDIRIKLVAYGLNKYKLTTTKKNGTQKTKDEKIEEIAGDLDGEVRTIYLPLSDLEMSKVYNGVDMDGKPIKRSKELKAKAQALLPKYKYEGFSGSFLTFGMPQVLPGETVTFYDDVIKERNNKTYIIKSVKTEFGSQGIRQMIEIDYKFDPNFLVFDVYQDKYITTFEYYKKYGL